MKLPQAPTGSASAPNQQTQPSLDSMSKPELLNKLTFHTFQVYKANLLLQAGQEEKEAYKKIVEDLISVKDRGTSTLVAGITAKFAALHQDIHRKMSALEARMKEIHAQKAAGAKEQASGQQGGGAERQQATKVK